MEQAAMKCELPVIVALAIGAGLWAACGSGSSNGTGNSDAGANDATSLSSSGGGGLDCGVGSICAVDSGLGSEDDSGPDGDIVAPLEGGVVGLPACQTGSDGVVDCGASRESCCTTLAVAGGTYFRTYTSDTDGGPNEMDGGPNAEADPARVSGFRLDKYLVTVGRFRQFVNAWNGGVGYAPPPGSGKHAQLNGGLGLASVGDDAGLEYETGWLASDDGNIAPTDANLACDPSFATWTTSAGSNERLPINCVNWWEAYAFCVWDGGFLPSEAEWECAAAGGSQQLEYPWGSTDPGTENQYAIYDCQYPSGSPGGCTDVSNIAPVGTATLGAGLWGQLDLAGDLWEWNLDWYAESYVDPCSDCAYLLPASSRVFRGGSFYDPTSHLFPPYRSGDSPASRYDYLGFRCARSP
jgi:sulfatase modifying factor 1